MLWPFRQAARKPSAGSRWLRSLLELIEQEEQNRAEGRIRQAGQNSARPTPALGHVDQSTSDGEIDRGMHQIKTQSHQEAGAGVFHVQFYAQRGGSVAHYSLGNAVESDRIMTQHVLRQAMAKKMGTSRGKSI